MLKIDDSTRPQVLAAIRAAIESAAQNEDPDPERVDVFSLLVWNRDGRWGADVSFRQNGLLFTILAGNNERVAAILHGDPQAIEDALGLYEDRWIDVWVDDRWVEQSKIRDFVEINKSTRPQVLAAVRAATERARHEQNPDPESVHTFALAIRHNGLYWTAEAAFHPRYSLVALVQDDHATANAILRGDEAALDDAIDGYDDEWVEVVVDGDWVEQGRLAAASAG